MERFYYRVQSAKSGQSSCMICHLKIPRKNLRLARMSYSTPSWMDFDCFVKFYKPTSISHFADVSLLEPEDQEDLRKGIEASLAGTVFSSERASKRPHPDELILKDFAIEYAKSGTADCAVCEVKISKGEIRVKKILNKKPLWHHVDCFGQIRGDLGLQFAADLLSGFEDLELEDMKTVLKTLKPTTVLGVPPLKRKKLEGEESLLEQKKKELVKSQNERLCEYKEEFSTFEKDDLVEILEYNGQRVANDKEMMVNHLSDCLAFGSFAPCPKCGGQIRFDNNAYICTGQSPELCAYRARDPKRVPTIIPTEHNYHIFLSHYRCEVKNRCLPNYQRNADSLFSEKTQEEKDAIDIPFVVREKPRLQKMEFLVLGKMKRRREEIKKIVEKAGGKISNDLHYKLAAVIAPKKMVEEMTDGLMQLAKTLNIQVVAEEFLDVFMTVDPIQYIQTQSICDWGSDPRQRIRWNKGSPYEKSVPKSVILELKNGSAVDPDSKLQDVAHVYQENNIKYDAVLALTEIQSGRNSFYKLQLLKMDEKNRFLLFCSWGRIGTKISDMKTEDYFDSEEAKKSFEEEYFNKTGNNWMERDVFVECPGMYYPLDIDYGKEAKSLSEFCAIPSKLDPRVQDLIKLIFDIDEMRKVMWDFELDVDKMPLGNLSQYQIKASYGVLKEISDLIGSNGSKMRFIEASNRFYTLIPHSFGVSVPPVLNTLEQVRKKMDMLESLMEIDVAYKMLTSNESVDTSDVLHPIDSCYNQLKAKIVPLEKTSPVYAYLERYARNTHAVTHKKYKLEIEGIYRVRRAGEAARYETFKTLHNRRLLWHGSGLYNFVGILSHGLKIDPPEAPPTGAMFGKGLYFADMVSKAANYSVSPWFWNPRETGLMLLCEVALGNMKKCTSAEDIQSLPPDMHSTWGMGRTYPNPQQSLKRKDGVVVPLGQPIVNESLESSLLYNEFIVYTEEQVNIQYLFKVKFNHRR